MGIVRSPSVLIKLGNLRRKSYMQADRPYYKRRHLTEAMTTTTWLNMKRHLSNCWYHIKQIRSESTDVMATLAWIGLAVIFAGIRKKYIDSSELRRGVRSDAQLSCTETWFQKCSQNGKNSSKHPMLSLSMVYNVISFQKIKRNP